MNYLFIRNCVLQSLKTLNLQKPKNFVVEMTRNLEYGDFATNVAMILAKPLKKNPLEIAEKLSMYLAKEYKHFFLKVEAVKPGFINFFINPKIYNKALAPFLEKNYHAKPLLKSQIKKINMEYVSANPTGALHLGHVRNAYVGNVLINLLRAVGHKVTSEYWINDMGTQIALFEVSVLVRYFELFNKKVEFPKGGYPGEDPYLVARKMKEKFGDKFLNVKWDENNIIKNKKTERIIWRFCIDTMLNLIREHLSMIGVEIKTWTSETKVFYSGIIERLMRTGFKNHTYKKDGALWLKTTDGGQDDKDRVLVKSDGSRTYFVTDIANQANKKSRGFDLFLHVWGSDHEGHVKRMKLAMPIIKAKPDQLEVVLIQMVKLEKGGKELTLSKRAGTALTIPDLLKFMSVDTSRWYVLAQSPNTQIVIDVDKATKNDNSNPVYYVQYAHARVCQLLKKAKLPKGFKQPKEFTKLIHKTERALIDMLFSLDPLLYSVVKSYEPQRVVTYVHELAKAFHAWYNECRVNDLTDLELKGQRICLAKAARSAIKYCLNLLGISAPIKMDHVQK
ncbi:arginine--tRNA ligase [[Mycoplasma] testudinis]|uniref:arginine--tRNA ligase n=1 Tax=[Mycoplasma] testudinis TaxID=33924 RepID=UPI0004837B41|nr:arginine--tRNA ligase [[Mycoplasma] testudinis]